MSDNYFAPLWTDKTTVPVKRVGSRWEFFYGGDVPVQDGAMGELTISTHQISDPTFLQRVTQKGTFKVLEEGTSLQVALSDQSQSGNPIGQWPTPYPNIVPPGTTRWERVTLGPSPSNSSSSKGNLFPNAGGLWLKVKGLQRCELCTSTILMPDGFKMPNGFAGHSVNSLNHALTLLSQAYEKHRISNTGNVYTRVYYQDKDGGWYPLDDLRSGVQAKSERQLLFDTWAQIEIMLGWRPVSMPKRARK